MSLRAWTLGSGMDSNPGSGMTLAEFFKIHASVFSPLEWE